MPTIDQPRLSKTIGDLTFDISNLNLNFQNFYLPSQYENQNYRISVKNIVDLVSLETLSLQNVDNTSDLLKPVSNATAELLNAKSNTDHTHTVLQISNLASLLQDKLSRGEPIALSSVENLSLALEQKSAVGHNHTVAEVSGLQTTLSSLALSNHTHALSSLQGYSDFLTSISNSLGTRPTIETTQQMIDTTIDNSTVIQTMIDNSIIAPTVVFLQGDW